MDVRFTPKAERQLKKLSSEIQKRIVAKLRFFERTKNPLHFAKPLNDPRLPQFRFRIGDYRASFDVVDNIIWIITVKHRREAYE